MSTLRPFYVIACAETGYQHGRRTYATETAARRAARRAADATGRRIAYGLAGGSALDGYTVKVQSGAVAPRRREEEAKGMMAAEEMVRHAKRAAYLLGYSDGKRGRVSYADCPYSCAGDLREAWQEGYSDGRAGRPMRDDDATSGRG